MTFKSKRLGSLGETLASQFLQKNRYKILKRNLRTKYGEIDILAQDGKTLVIVEVKAKTSDFFGVAAEMLTLKKRQKLELLAREVSVKYETDDIRIDAVTIDTASSQPRLELFKGIGYN